MRLSDRVIFCYEEKGVYNPKTSKYDVIKTFYEEIPCNLSPISMQRIALEFGDISRKISIIRLKGQYDKKVSHAYINDVKYKIIRPILYKHDTAFYIESVD